jgi:hypothetical protein
VRPQAEPTRSHGTQLVTTQRLAWLAGWLPPRRTDRAWLLPSQSWPSPPAAPAAPLRRRQPRTHEPQTGNDEWPGHAQTYDTARPGPRPHAGGADPDCGWHYAGLHPTASAPATAHGASQTRCVCVRVSGAGEVPWERSEPTAQAACAWELCSAGALTKRQSSASYLTLYSHAPCMHSTSEARLRVGCVARTAQAAGRGAQADPSNALTGQIHPGPMRHARAAVASRAAYISAPGMRHSLASTDGPAADASSPSSGSFPKCNASTNSASAAVTSGLSSCRSNAICAKVERPRLNELGGLASSAQ